MGRRLTRAQAIAFIHYVPESSRLAQLQSLAEEERVEIVIALARALREPAAEEESPAEALVA